MSTVDIATGFYNKLLDREKSLQKDRMKVCKACKLLKVDKIFGEVCNKRLYLNPKTDEVSKTPKPEFYNGCGCFLDPKTRTPNSKCPVGKW